MTTPDHIAADRVAAFGNIKSIVRETSSKVVPVVQTHDVVGDSRIVSFSAASTTSAVTASASLASAGLGMRRVRPTARIPAATIAADKNL